MKSLSLILIASTLIGTTSKAAIINDLNAKKVQIGKKNAIIVKQVRSKDFSKIKEQLEKQGIHIINWKDCLPDNNISDTQKPDVEKPDNSTQANYIEEVVNLVNQERKKQGLSPLSFKKDIANAANVRAKEIQTSFSHTRPDGRNFSTVLSENNVSFKGVGENIAWGQKTPEEVMKGWMNSAGHRANILNKNFTSIGVGYYQSESGRQYWTQLFTY